MARSGRRCPAVHGNILEGLRAIGRHLSVFLGVIASPYRVAAEKLRSHERQVTKPECSLIVTALVLEEQVQ